MKLTLKTLNNLLDYIYELEKYGLKPTTIEDIEKAIEKKKKELLKEKK